MNAIATKLKQSGMTAKELAESVRAPYSTILAYTSGARGVGTKHLVQIARALNCEAHELIQREDCGKWL